MTVAIAHQEAHSHSGVDLALAAVIGGSARAAAAASAILASFADEKNIDRAAHIANHESKQAASLFAHSMGAAGLNFANVGGDLKAPAAAPNVAETGITGGRG